MKTLVIRNIVDAYISGCYKSNSGSTEKLSFCFGFDFFPHFSGSHKTAKKEKEGGCSGATRTKRPPDGSEWVNS